MTKNIRGFVIEGWMLYVAGGVVLGMFLGGTRIGDMLKKNPPTKQLVELQAKYNSLEAKSQANEQKLKDASAAERRDLEAQVRNAQQLTEGAANALDRVTPEHRTVGVKAAANLIKRANLRLAMAIGKLPEDLQQEIVLIVDQMVSESEAERAAAEAKLAVKDAENKVLNQNWMDEREAKVKLEAERAQIARELATTKPKLEQVQGQVITYAQEQAKSNGFVAQMKENVARLWFWIKVAIGFLAFTAYGLPLVTKFMNAGPLKTFLRNISGYLLDPFHHHDATITIDELKKQVKSTTPTI